jgi:hypothetical protein
MESMEEESLGGHGFQIAVHQKRQEARGMIDLDFYQ